LIALGYSVNGSTTTDSKCSVLKRSGINPYLITADEKLSGENIDRFFHSGSLVITVPFRRNFEDPAEYQRQIEAVIAHCGSSPVQRVIFTSTTSIYPASLMHAVEDQAFEPDTQRAKVLVSIERALMAHRSFKATIVRIAGMYGGERRIGQRMAGRTGLHDGDSPVNLIHLDDCVAILTKIIQNDIYNTILNACSDGHPSREDLYTKAALHYGLTPPQFTGTPSKRRKVVSNEKLKKTLPYTFLYPDPLQFIDADKRKDRS